MLCLSLGARCTLATHSLRHSNHGRKHRTLRVCTDHRSTPVGTRTYEAPNTFLRFCSHIQGPYSALRQIQDCIRTLLGLYTHHVQNIPRGRAFDYSPHQPIPVHIHTYVVCCTLRGLKHPAGPVLVPQTGELHCLPIHPWLQLHDSGELHRP